MSGINVDHEHGNEYLDTCRMANVYFTSDVDAKGRMRDLNEHDKINGNKIRRTSLYDDEMFNDSQNSEHDFDEEVESIDSEQSMIDYEDLSMY